MSLKLSERLLPLLREAFPNEAVELGPQAHILATYTSPHPEVGCVAIQDDGDEITLFLGGRTHMHFGSYDDDLSEERRSLAIAEQVVVFLRRLFADEIEFYGNGAAGGCRERSEVKRGFVSRILLGHKSYVWSGPVA
jgi:hypothetical protein